TPGDGCVGDGCIGDGCVGAAVICSGVGKGAGKGECVGEGKCSGEWEGSVTSSIVGNRATSWPEIPL
ncbi:hypothetical protein Tco_0501593, partial [Tanacetum coccineum]